MPRLTKATPEEDGRWGSFLGRRYRAGRVNTPGSPWFCDTEGRYFSAYEIEAILAGVSGVSEVGVIRKNGRLRAYYTTVSGKGWRGLEKRLRAAVRLELAGREHLWPQYYIHLEEMPYLRDTDKGIDRRRLHLNQNLERKPIAIPHAVEAVNEWRFEGVIVAVPSRKTIVVAHKPNANRYSNPTRIVIGRDDRFKGRRLHPGRWGIFEGKFRGDQGMLLTAFTLVPRQRKEIRLSNTTEVFDVL